MTKFLRLKTDEYDHYDHQTFNVRVSYMISSMRLKTGKYNHVDD